MWLSAQTLIDGVIRSLRESVLPALAERQARAQLHAALDVLNNLRDRIELKSSLAETEAESIVKVLAGVAVGLDDDGEAEAAEEIRDGMAAAGRSHSTERVAEWRALLNRTLELLTSLPPASADRARSIIGKHLATQAVRDVLPLKPSPLREISEG